MGVSVKRIVVTGMGIVSPLGCGVQHVWQSLLAGKSGVTRLSEQLVADIPCKVAGQVPSIDSDPLHGFDPLATIPAKERKKMDRFIEFALVAAREALTQAGWSPASAAEQERTATVIATGIGGFSEIANAVHTTDERGLIVIESLEHALARGATPLAELVGYGTSADAYHLTAGPEDGNGARRAMEIAIRQAGVTVDEIDHINAHATSTQVGDKGELAAIKTLFGAHPVAITSTKSATGHLLGAAGGIEAIFTIQALRDQVVPPTLNLHHPDEDAAGMNLVALQARPQKMRYALSNGFGFGGVNASLLLKRWQ
ncbi:TPA: hypothetical protein MFL76_002906 [Klebsiella pneumoniae]|nr:hypothetical protein [Klebsiella pneumoniae]